MYVLLPFLFLLNRPGERPQKLKLLMLLGDRSPNLRNHILDFIRTQLVKLKEIILLRLFMEPSFLSALLIRKQICRKNYEIGA